MISWERVTELREEVGEDDFAEVIELFLEEVDEVMTRLRTSPDQTTYEADLHFLKGSALNLGFRALSALCQDGERQIAVNPTDSFDFDRIFDTYEKSKAEFLSREASVGVH